MKMAYKPPWPTIKDRAFRQKHHILPSSRGGGNQQSNILDGIPSDDHWAWHKLFGNLTPREIMFVLLSHLFKGGKYRPYRRSIDKKEPAAPEMTGDEIIFALMKFRIIPREWIPSDGLMATLEKRREE